MLIYFSVVIPSFSAAATAAEKGLDEKKSFNIPETADPISFSNGIIGLNFLPETSGFGLSAIKNIITGHDFLAEHSEGLVWELEFNHISTRLITINNKVECTRSHNIEKSADGKSMILNLLWKDIPLENEKQAVDVHVTVRLDKSSLSYWHIDVENRSKSYGTWKVVFPAISGLKASPEETVQLAYPDFGGCLLRDPVRMINERQNADPRPPHIMDYPSARCTMQFSTLFETSHKNGLYLATYDAGAYGKKFGYDVESNGLTLKYVVRNFPAGMGIPGGNTYEMPYEAVVGVYEGDWITASKIYREWANKQLWCSKGKLSGRNDIPEWYKNIVTWFCVRQDDIDTKKMIATAKYLNVPVAFQWYEWHQIPYDTFYPDYFPPVPEFFNIAKELQASGIRIAPYINSRIWDTNSESWKKENPYQAATKVPYLPYSDLISYSLWSSESWKDLTISLDHWNNNPFAVMCPGTKIWQDKQSGIVARLVTELGMDGVYMDQTASCQPVYCFDPSHGHTIGGGNYWVMGNRKLIETCRQNALKKKQGFILTTEDFAEPYIDVFDGLLACNMIAIAPDNIPMFSYVYNGYCLRYGRYNNSSGLPFMMRNAQMFLWGEQMGWFDPKILDLESWEAKYFKTLCSALDKKEVKKYLFFGEMMRPPVLEGENPVLRAPLSPGQKDAEMQAVSHSAWKAEDGSVGLVLTNLDEVSHSVKYRFSAADFGLDDTKGYSVTVIAGEGTGKIMKYRTGSFVRTEKMPAGSVLVLEIK